MSATIFKDGPMTKPLGILAGALAEDPGTHGILMLIDLENRTGRSYVDWRVVENVVSEHVPAETGRMRTILCPSRRCGMPRPLLDRFRQRAGTAKGVIFLAPEGETAVINVIVWRKMYERFRRAVIAGPRAVR